MQFHDTLDNALIGFNAFKNVTKFRGDFCLLNEIIFPSSMCFSIHPFHDNTFQCCDSSIASSLPEKNWSM